jgi:hypothetical protein
VGAGADVGGRDRGVRSRTHVDRDGMTWLAFMRFTFGSPLRSRRPSRRDVVASFMTKMSESTASCGARA